MRDEEHSLTHRFSNLSALNNAFMSFVYNGGIFIPTEADFHLGDFINISITLPERDQTFIFSGEVIWVTPKSIHDNFHRPGVGIQCTGDEGTALIKAIQSLLMDFKEESNSDTL